MDQPMIYRPGFLSTLVEKEFVVDRSFEDFEWLHECMTATNDFPGLIFPPLPKKPNVDNLVTESERRIRRGSSLTRVMG